MLHRALDSVTPDRLLPAHAQRRSAWPLPALLAWALAWTVFALLRFSGAADWLALALGSAAGIVLAAAGSTRWRRLIIAGGFPLSLLASGVAAGLPGWAWLLPLAFLFLAYPVHAWRDAPLFPTPADALNGLQPLATLAPGARVLDAGCGLGHGLRALRHVYPRAQVEGVEWSWPLALLARLRCPWARVRRGDMWKQDWSGYALVYLFQRPESMDRALAKARTEMAAGAWLVSLEFEAAAAKADAVLKSRDGRPVWLYRMPGPHC
jgi:SAM-dependent methyltransferase